MALFSEKYGYIKPSDVIIVEQMPTEIVNAVINSFRDLYGTLGNSEYEKLEKYVSRYYLKENILRFDKDAFSFELMDVYQHKTIIPFLLNINNEWYRKLDIIECTLSYLKENKKIIHISAVKTWIETLNSEFEQLHYGYRIIDNSIVPVTSKIEIQTIEETLCLGNDAIRVHINAALAHLAMKPNGDYRNSIKEAISAVEAFNRQLTGGKDLNFKEMEKKGIILPSTLRNAFNQLYGYTNDGTTGIRHALIESSNVPTEAEAIFMLVSCCAFLNYLTKIRNTLK